jgi:primosomal protein N'
VQALIQSNDREKLHQYLSRLMDILEVNKPRFGITWNLDIDPIEI